MGPADSHPLSRDGYYSGYSSDHSTFVYGAITLYGGSFQSSSTSFVIPKWSPTTPERQVFLVWACPLSLAATDGVDFSFTSSAYLDVSVQRVCDLCLTVFNCAGCPIRTSADQGSFAPPLPQVSTLERQTHTTTRPSPSLAVPQVSFLPFSMSFSIRFDIPLLS